jgi:hypothetical protein
MGDFHGGLWDVHGMSVDSDGNLYVAEVDSGRVQKFKPRAGANSAYLAAKPAPGLGRRTSFRERNGADLTVGP